MNWYLRKIDSKGGHRLETIDRDMDYLRKDFTRLISWTKNALIGILEELEIKLEKLEVKVVKLEAAALATSSSCSRYGEKYN